MAEPVVLIASGDLRLSANLVCWPAQEAAEAAVTAAIQNLGYQVERGHAADAGKGHGFIDSQKYGMEVFRNISPTAPLVVCEAVWQYSHHVLSGLMTHQGPILTVANWSGQWPGLVGMLNLNGSLSKAGVKYSSLWSVDFTDEFFLKGLRSWLETGAVEHDLSHVRALASVKLPEDGAGVGRKIAGELKKNKAIMGVFDEGCMGMYNAIIPDELLHQTGIFKERLSQSALFAAMRNVSDAEAQAVRDWYDSHGLKFSIGTDPSKDLTDDQILSQCKMYVAAVRIADDFGCDTIGIQYQQGLKDICPASDLVEGTLNNVERPPVLHAATGEELYAGEALPHFNEVDECAGFDGLLTYRIWRELGFDPENTLHDLRYGADFEIDGKNEFVWLFLISGAAPPAHFIGGWQGASSDRQPSMYFPLGGGTLKGVSKAGELVWSRVYVENGQLNADIGVGKAVELPAEENERRWNATTPQWPIMHAVTYGVSRDQMMAKHKANHIQVAYAPDLAGAQRALAAKAAAFAELGIAVNICGEKTGLA